MRRWRLAGVALAAGGMSLVTAPTALAEINGTYTGKTAEGATITVNIAGNTLVSVSSIVVTRLNCELFTSSGGTVSDGSEQSAFAIDTTPQHSLDSVDTVGGEPVGGHFSFGSSDPAGPSRELAQGEQSSSGNVSISQTGARLDYSFTLVTARTPASPADGPATSRRTCSGGDSIELTRGGTGGNTTTKNLAAPSGLKATKVALPKLSELGDQALVVSAKSKKKGGLLEVDVRLANGSDDPFQIGEKSLGDGKRGIKPGKQATLKVPVKGTLGAPDANASVSFEITLTFSPDGGGEGKSKTTVVRVPT